MMDSSKMSSGEFNGSHGRRSSSVAGSYSSGYSITPAPAPSGTQLQCLRVANHKQYMGLLVKGSGSKYVDLKFLCSDGYFWSHKLVIANVSPFLASCFDDQLPGELTVVSVEEVPVKILGPMLDLAYSGQCRVSKETFPAMRECMKTLGWIRFRNLEKSRIVETETTTWVGPTGTPVGTYPDNHERAILPPLSVSSPLANSLDNWKAKTTPATVTSEDSSEGTGNKPVIHVNGPVIPVTGAVTPGNPTVSNLPSQPLSKGIVEVIDLEDSDNEECQRETKTVSSPDNFKDDVFPNLKEVRKGVEPIGSVDSEKASRVNQAVADETKVEAGKGAVPDKLLTTIDLIQKKLIHKRTFDAADDEVFGHAENGSGGYRCVKKLRLFQPNSASSLHHSVNSVDGVENGVVGEVEPIKPIEISVDTRVKAQSYKTEMITKEPPVT